MKKYQALSVALLFVAGIAIAGIYRSDKKESEYAKLASEPQFNCVGQVFCKGNDLPASCVLVSDRYVLSAAHVFIKAFYRNDTIVSNGQILVNRKPYNPHVGKIGAYSVLFNGEEYKCKAIKIYPGYLDTTTDDALDIALLELKEPVKGITPAEINTGYDELHANGVGVGWGIYGPADKPQDIVEREPKKLAGENVIDSIGGYMINNKPILMFCDFDSPTDTSCNKLGSPIPRPLEYLCSRGDSGGGLFLQTGAGWKLAGICHNHIVDSKQMAKTGYYGQVMSWVRVSVFADWIEQNIKP